MPYPGFKNNRNEYQDKPRRRIEIDTVGQTETFFTANVKLVTFIVCMVVLLALIGPWSVVRIMRWYQDYQVEQTEVHITVAQLDALVAKGERLNWVDFDGYTCEVVADDAVYICKYTGENGEFYLLVTSPAKGKTVESVVLIDLRDNSQTELKAQE